jgi:hypothetical protein
VVNDHASPQVVNDVVIRRQMCRRTVA